MTDLPDSVRKVGAYGGPGVIVSRFTGLDGKTRYVVAHEIAGGHGHFYHIYVRSNLEPRTEEQDHGRSPDQRSRT